MSEIKASELTALKMEIARRDLRRAITAWCCDEATSGQVVWAIEEFQQIAILHGRTVERERINRSRD